MREDSVYYYTKRWFTDAGFRILAGQPPNGTDRFPVIEVKSGTNNERGSRNVFKPDLIAATDLSIVLVECKPRFSQEDVDKLRSIRDDQQRRTALVEELRQRRVLESNDLGSSYREALAIDQALRFAIAFEGSRVDLSDIYSLVLESNGDGSLYLGDDIISSL
jgi:hypothetical protein